MFCLFWESVSPSMTPQPLMSPNPYQYRAGSAWHQAERARHRALGIERTAAASGPLATAPLHCVGLTAQYESVGRARSRYRVERAPRRPLDAAGRARGQLNAAPAVRQTPRAIQSMPTAHRPKARLPTARRWRWRRHHWAIFPRRPAPPPDGQPTHDPTTHPCRRRPTAHLRLGPPTARPPMASAPQQPAPRRRWCLRRYCACFLVFQRDSPFCSLHYPHQAYHRRLPRRHSDRRHLRQLMILSQE